METIQLQLDEVRITNQYVGMEQAFECLKKIFLARISGDLHSSADELLKSNPFPAHDLHKSEVLFQLFDQHQLNDREKLLLLLCISTHYIPDFLNAMMLAPPNESIPSKLFGMSRSSINEFYIPTVETGLMILAGLSVGNRHGAMRLFVNQSKLIKNHLLRVVQAGVQDSFTSLRIMPDEKLLQMLLTGEKEDPHFSGSFPATLLETDYSWEELVLPYDTRQQINEVKDWVEFEKLQHGAQQVNHKFKMGCKCLFHGPPGTGKSLTASLLGKYTEKKVYRIDLSAVVSKYIGETEKNLAYIFDQAQDGNWILFFDEADALFGKRGNTKSAHDRYANQEVSYLLQRFETYEGLCILASNLIDNIDPAFYRRFHSIVHFTKPGADERNVLWNNYLPDGYEWEEGIKIDEVAQSVDITGAGIYNVMRRAFMKAVLRNDTTIQGQDLLESVRLEKKKEGKII